METPGSAPNKSSKSKRIQVSTYYEANEALFNLRHAVPNTAIIERWNGKARCMNKEQVQRTLAFARHPLA